MFSSIPAPPITPTLIYSLRGPSEPVGGARHDTGRVPHERADRRRQALTAGRGRRGAVRDFLRPHGFKYGTAAVVPWRQPAEVVVQMPFHLALGLDHESEARPIAGQRRERADGEGSGVPQGTEKAGTRA